MAKSLRSKTKLAARRRKANMSHYAVADAERTARISARIVAKAGVKEDAEGDAEMEGDEEMTEGECERSEAGGWDARREARSLQSPSTARPLLSLPLGHQLTSRDQEDLDFGAARLAPRGVAQEQGHGGAPEAQGAEQARPPHFSAQGGECWAGAGDAGRSTEAASCVKLRPQLTDRARPSAAANRPSHR